jgi:formate/nitrite transporter FocA (FNT family)
MKMTKVRGQVRTRPRRRARTLPEAFMWGMFCGSLLCLIVFITILGGMLGKI